MARQQISLKQLAINKDNSTILIVVGLASFITVFSLVASKALISQQTYQAKVINKKEVALKQLKTNAGEVDKLKNAYQAFAEKDKNVLGGNKSGTGPKDGENPRLVLDALPSKYDFPGLTTSLNNLFKQYSVESIGGTDDEITQSAAASEGSPQALEIPIAMTVTGSSQSAADMLSLYERSIRPITIQKLSITGDDGAVQYNVTAKTYFQPQKKFDVKMEKVK